MNKITRGSLLAVALMSAGAAIAHEHGPDRRGHREAPGPALPVIEHLTRAFRHLDLSEEQKAGVHADLEAMRAQIRPLMKAVHDGRRELHGLITAESYDAEAVAAAAAQQGSLTARITEIAAGAAAGVLARLTGEQRSELAAMGEKHRARRESRMRRMHEHLGRRLGEE